MYKSRFYQYAAAALVALGLYLGGMALAAQAVSLVLGVFFALEVSSLLYRDIIIALKSVPVIVKDATSSARAMRESLVKVSRLAETFNRDIPLRVNAVAQQIEGVGIRTQREITALGGSVRENIAGISEHAKSELTVIREEVVGKFYQKIAQGVQRLEDNLAKPLKATTFFVLVNSSCYMLSPETAHYSIIPTTILLAHQFYADSAQQYTSQLRSSLGQMRPLERAASFLNYLPFMAFSFFYVANTVEQLRAIEQEESQSQGLRVLPTVQAAVYSLSYIFISCFCFFYGSQTTPRNRQYLRLSNLDLELADTTERLCANEQVQEANLSDLSSLSDPGVQSSSEVASSPEAASGDDEQLSFSRHEDSGYGSDFSEDSVSGLGQSHSQSDSRRQLSLRRANSF